MMQENQHTDRVFRGRQYSLIDRVIMGVQTAPDHLPLRRGQKAQSPEHPGQKATDGPLNEAARRHAAGLMRINHAGEVAAQALYRGQALAARDAEVKKHLLQAAKEEHQHLVWCDLRLRELGARPSRLSPLWYVGSFSIGALAGLAGDRRSLGFVEETERQVVEHLEDHLGSLPEPDRRSRAIIQAMQADESRHGDEAAAAGAIGLPFPVKKLMATVSRIMKFGAYRI